jgi:hypothetical protein
MFDRHEIIASEGAWSESFQPGDGTVAGMDRAQRDELFRLFPELEGRGAAARYPAARASLKAHEVRAWRAA